MRISDWSSDVCSSDLLHFDVTSGRLKGLVVKPSQVDITGLSTADASQRIYELLSIDAKAAGPVHDALSILDHPRLDLLSRLGMAAEGSGGTVDADLHFNFRSEEHTSELQSLMLISYAVFCLKKKKK